MAAILIFSEIVILVNAMLKLITMFDAAHNLKINKKLHILIIVCSLLYTACMMVLKLNIFPQGLLYGVFAAYLLTAAITDYQTQTVHDFIHVIAAAVGVVLFLINQPGYGSVASFVFFTLCQLLIFGRFFGRADMYAFIVCGLFFTASGKDSMTCLMHMSSVYIILAVVQAFRRNINRKGNLKVPVALLPYIASTAIWFV